MSGEDLLRRLLAGLEGPSEAEALFAQFAQAAREHRAANSRESDELDAAWDDEPWPEDPGAQQPSQVVRQVAGISEGPPVQVRHSGGGWTLSWSYPVWTLRLEGPSQAVLLLREKAITLHPGESMRVGSGPVPDELRLRLLDGRELVLRREG